MKKADKKATKCAQAAEIIEPVVGNILPEEEAALLEEKVEVAEVSAEEPKEEANEPANVEEVVVENPVVLEKAEEEAEVEAEVVKQEVVEDSPEEKVECDVTPSTEILDLLKKINETLDKAESRIAALEKLNTKASEEAVVETAETVVPADNAVVEEVVVEPACEEVVAPVTLDKEDVAEINTPAETDEVAPAEVPLEEHVPEATIENAVDDALDTAEKEKEIVDFKTTSNPEIEEDEKLTKDFTDVLECLKIGKPQRGGK